MTTAHDPAAAPSLAQAWLAETRLQLQNAHEYLEVVVTRVFPYIDTEDETMNLSILEKLIDDIDGHVGSLSKLRDDASMGSFATPGLKLRR